MENIKLEVGQFWGSESGLVVEILGAIKYIPDYGSSYYEAEVKLLTDDCGYFLESCITTGSVFKMQVTNRPKSEQPLKLLENYKKPHIHAELIKAWADGAEIECYNECDGTWKLVDDPMWFVGIKYRIKPKKAKDYIEDACIGHKSDENPPQTPNVRFTYDGETKKLKAVEMI